MQLIIKFNKGFRFLLFVIDVFCKYAWVVSLKDKKSASIVNAMMDINEVLLLWFINFLIKSRKVVVSLMNEIIN